MHFSAIKAKSAVYKHEIIIKN